MNDIKLECPPECQVVLQHMKDDIKKCEQMDETLWEEMKVKVSQKLFLWMMGIGVVVLIATFGALYRQGGQTLDKVQATREAAIKVETRQEVLLETLSALIHADIAERHRGPTVSGKQDSSP
jgi:hypothetical protein